MNTILKSQLTELLRTTLEKKLGTTPKNATKSDFYKACALIVKDILAEKRHKALTRCASNGDKRIYYLSMEFLMGRSLKNNLYNLGLQNKFASVLSSFDISLEELYEEEPDAGLGNGGLGRLAACYLDGMASIGCVAEGHSICYEYGIFRQKLVDGWQTELPDNWLPGGKIWLTESEEQGVEVRFGGQVEELWDNGYHSITHKNYTTVQAVPFDMFVSGYDSEEVSVLRLWLAKGPEFNMELFNKGDYVSAVSEKSYAEAISKVLYPNDNHKAGKELRLRQQYFLCAAAIGDIVAKHLAVYGTFDNFDKKNAIHVNDTHPTLAIPELMRILLDECGYSWEKSFEICKNTFAYTNHTVMSEALECWDEELLKELLPRIYQIIRELDNRFKSEVFERFSDIGKAARVGIIWDHQIRMANLCCYACHSINGVSKLHSEIIKEKLFADFYELYPEKFTNVTNGIAYRRWLLQSNPGLTSLLSELIGPRFKSDASQLTRLLDFKENERVLERLQEIKKENKQRLAEYVREKNGVMLDCDSIFDVQVKRLHEYKRQHLSALHILHLYNQLLENPELDIPPRTFLFAAKAAPGYYMAKQIIKLIYSIAKELEQNPKIREKLRVVFLEDYSVTVSELLMPAAEISEQISLAGTEASGTGNMKLMINGAVTLGTLDGANIEIAEAVGDENIFIFGMRANEVEELRRRGYHPLDYHRSSSAIRAATDRLSKGIAGNNFDEIASNLILSDPYMVLADFESYMDAQSRIGQSYQTSEFTKMSLCNIAGAGIFSADRAVMEYAKRIWQLKPSKRKR